ncbi:MAG TPA: DUF1028 domain-containing protein [Candidatus Sulfopaludibacter sp.]|nr:DUF1028 domain-containing protein [Candidatus Sulfopaludibacter sp.]
MRRAVLWALCCAAPAWATWSVVAVDRSTGRVVISSSTCTGTTDDFLKDVQAVVVPGKGVAACQAGVDSATHQNQTLVFDELQRGADPARIIEMLSEDPGFQSRQYGIVDLQGRMAGHSGLTNGFVSQDMHGQVPGTEIFYSIQGNILRTGGVVPAAVKAFLAAKGGVTDRVMAAMEAADAAGGDSRCTCQTPAVPPQSASIPCTIRTSLVAYILAADPGDSNGPAGASNSHNNGKYAMYITVSQPNHGPAFQIKPGEDLDPVKTLRMRYDGWIQAHPEFRR